MAIYTCRLVLVLVVMVLGIASLQNCGSQESREVQNDHKSQVGSEQNETEDNAAILEVMNLLIQAGANQHMAGLLKVLHPFALQHSANETRYIEWILFDVLARAKVPPDAEFQIEGDAAAIDLDVAEAQFELTFARIDQQWYFDPFRLGGGTAEEVKRRFEELSALEADLTEDRKNLASLVDVFVSKSARGTPVPSSEGYRFWVALFVGDGPGGNFQVNGPGDSNTYLCVRSANLLRSPFDSDVLPLKTLRQELERLLESGEGAAGAIPEMCSYAGPRRDENESLRTALFSNKNRSGYIGATGIRSGVPMFSDGLNAVNQDAGAIYISFDDMLEQGHLPSNIKPPGFGTGTFKWVIYDPD